jgi:hypothetical protein
MLIEFVWCRCLFAVMAGEQDGRRAALATQALSRLSLEGLLPGRFVVEAVASCAGGKSRHIMVSGEKHYNGCILTLCDVFSSDRRRLPYNEKR